MSDPRAKLAELRAAIARHQSLPPRTSAGRLPTGLEPVDQPLNGGLPKGGLIELVCPADRIGASTLITALLRRRADENQWSALIDGGDHFDVQSAGATALSRLLWIRCHHAKEAFRAADLLLRDANLPLILFDIRGCPPNELRRIPATTWYRFQRILEPTAVALLAITHVAQVPCAVVRLELASNFDLNDLDEDLEVLVARCHLDAKRQFTHNLTQAG
jgi:hypothetical protein